MKLQMTNEQIAEIASQIGTTDTKKIGYFMVNAVMDAGFEMTAAFDFVFGQGAYRELSDDVYAHLQAA